MTETKDYTIPPKSRKEWQTLVTGTTDFRFKNFVLQMKSAEYASKIKSNLITVDNAVDDIYNLCNKYKVAVQIDLKEFFKSW